MFDLGKEEITLECPTCNITHHTTLQLVANQAIIHCSCGTDIQLKDSGGSAKKGIREMNDAVKELDDLFK
jgi:hypothetical protein